jgi:coatomer protein complex subunit gamma
MFSNHIVFQFDCTNTLNDQILEGVAVHVDPAEGFELVSQLPCAKLVYNTPGTTYTCLLLPSDPTQVTGTFSNTLKFKVKDCDPTTGEPDDEEGYDDEYVLEDMEVLVADHVQRMMKPNFGAAWEEVGAQNELEDTYALTTMKSMDDAVKNIIQFMGMQPCERSDRVSEGKTTHTLFLSGVYRGGHDVLVRSRLALSDAVTMNLTVRSTDPHVSEVIASAVG